MVQENLHHKKLCSGCPMAKTADLIGDFSVLLIVRDLLSGAKRFGDLESSLSGISTRTLTKKLKMLEGEKIVKRKEYVGKPPRVEYLLTKKGKALHVITEDMRAYGKKYL